MANFSKSFNFRNGLQVDDDKLIVKPNTGLVGIGSTIPTEVLDVKGNIKSSGIVTSPNIVAGTGITVGTGVNQISLDGVTGFITAKNYFGDGSTLTNVVAIATAGFKELSGTLSTSFSVGIGSLNVGGVGITTGKFPDFTLDVIGDMRVTGPSTFIGVTTISDLFADTLSISDASSFNGGATIDQANITGVSTFGGNLDINADVDLSGSVTSNLTVDGTVSLAGVATFTSGSSGDIIFTPKTNTSGFKIRNNDSANILQVFPNLTPPTAALTGKFIPIDIDVNGGLTVAGVSSFTNTTNSVSATSGAVIISGGVGISKRVNVASDVTVGGILYVQGAGSQIFVDSGSFIDCNGNLDVDGHTELDNVNIAGVVTATTVDSNQLKLLHNGTQVLNTIGAGVSVSNTLNVISLNGGSSGLSSSSGSLRYGNQSASAPYSTRRSLDLINNDSGNVNFYLNASDLSVPVGGSDFHWHKGFNNTRLMTLTNSGNLGIGLTTPSSKLHVLGTANITGATDIGGNLDVSGDLTVGGTFNSDVVGNVTGSLTGDILAGIATFNNGLLISGVTTSTNVKTDRLSINTNSVSQQLQINSGDNQVFVSVNGNLGIRTDETFGNAIFTTGSSISNLVGIGTTITRSAVDFTDAGKNVTGVFANRMYMLPPKITTAQRGSLTGVSNGALIFNTDGNQLQVYIDGWVGIGTTTKVDS